tara:strand:+ start:1365 stop:2243 length:879 start_codon:yes stop_codon:yes gene_type:complete
MIDIEYKKEIATGIKTKNIYKPNQNADYKISRSKFDNFKKCQRCFYFDVVKGFVEPGTPGWALNSQTDALLKKEFDRYRKEEKAHPYFSQEGITEVIPYKNNNIARNYDGHIIKSSKIKKPYSIMDAWRSNHHGVSIRYKQTNLILYGAVDDIWLNTKTNELIVVDYKSQAKGESVDPETYFDEKYKLDYLRQLNFYAYLLRNQIGELKDLKISKKAYLCVVNARGLEDSFSNKLVFEPKLISVTLDEKDKDINEEINNMLHIMNSEQVPKPNKKCKNCAYSKRRAEFDMLK